MKQYLYKDNNGKLKKYVGNIKFVNDKPIGEIVETSIISKEVELTPVAEHEAIANVSKTKVWKGRDNKEYDISKCDEIDNYGRAVKVYNDSYKITFHPEVPEKTWFTYKGEVFEGEIIEENGKYYSYV